MVGIIRHNCHRHLKAFYVSVDPMAGIPPPPIPPVPPGYGLLGTEYTSLLDFVVLSLPLSCPIPNRIM